MERFGTGTFEEERSLALDFQHIFGVQGTEIIIKKRRGETGPRDGTFEILKAWTLL